MIFQSNVKIQHARHDDDTLLFYVPYRRRSREEWKGNTLAVRIDRPASSDPKSMLRGFIIIIDIISIINVEFPDDSHAPGSCLRCTTRRHQQFVLSRLIQSSSYSRIEFQCASSDNKGPTTRDDMS
jgi:hypothetical protein